MVSSKDGSGRIVRTDTDPQLVTAGDRQRWINAGPPTLGGGAPIDERALPSDRDALGQRVRETAIQNGGSGAREELDLIAELRRNFPLSPAQGAALYQVAAGLGGIELIEDDRDPSGPGRRRRQHRGDP